MSTEPPRTALEALARPRLAVGPWPWRSAAYLASTLLSAVPAFAVLGIPWLVLAVRLSEGDLGIATVLVPTLVGAVLAAGFGPLVAAPVANLERRRLRMVDTRPVKRGPAPARAGALRWLHGRYGEPAAWREVAWTGVLATVAPVAALAALLAVPVVGVFIASPFLVMAQGSEGAPVSLAVGQAATVEQTVPYVVAGVVLLPVLPYLMTLLAGAEAAAARALLGASDEQLRAELVEVSRSRARLVDAFEAERRRIERDLHDGAQQRLLNLTLQLGLAKLDVPAGSAAAKSVGSAHEQAKQLMAELRELIRGIQPQILTELGLPAAVGELADRSPVPVVVDTPIGPRPPAHVENTAYFVVAEALANVAKHSRAQNAFVTARQRGGTLTLVIRDDGRGGADPSGGTGLTGLADRVAVAGGTMRLSSPPGGPTVIEVELPCDRSA